jgi:hypothetical protein
MLPPGVQNVLFSATFPDNVQQFASEFAPEANQLYLKQEEVTVDAIKQLWMECDGEDQKYNALSALYDCMTIGQSIVFCRVSFWPTRCAVAYHVHFSAEIPPIISPNALRARDTRSRLSMERKNMLSVMTFSMGSGMARPKSSSRPTSWLEVSIFSR